MKEFKFGKSTIQIEDEAMKEIKKNAVSSVLTVSLCMGISAYFLTLKNKKQIKELEKIVFQNGAACNENFSVLAKGLDLLSKKVKE